MGTSDGDTMTQTLQHTYARARAATVSEHYRQILLRCILVALCAIATGLLVMRPVQAQSANGLPLPSLGNTGGVLKKIDINTMASILAEMQIGAERATANDGRQFLRAQTPGGARFFVDFIVCADRIAATGCGSALFRAGMSNAGVTYDDLNSFNKSSTVATGFNLPEINLIGFVRLAVAEGGVTRDNIILQLGLFLTDMDGYVKNRAGATSVRFDAIDDQASGSGSVIAASTDENGAYLLQNLTSEEDQLPRWAQGLTDSSMIESAIYNTYSVDFLTDEMRRYLTQ